MQTAAGREPTMAWLLFSPSGRLGRMPYALAWLFWVAALCMPLVQMIRHEGDQPALVAAFLIFVAAAVAATVSSIMLTIKRLHDMGAPAPVAICLFIPAISFFALLAFCVWPGKPGPNEYGRLTNRPKV